MGEDEWEMGGGGHFLFNFYHIFKWLKDFERNFDTIIRFSLETFSPTYAEGLKRVSMRYSQLSITTNYLQILVHKIYAYLIDEVYR